MQIRKPHKSRSSVDLSDPLWRTTAILLPAGSSMLTSKRAVGPTANYFSASTNRSGIPVIYPAGLSPGIQSVLGAFVVALNAALYVWMLRRGKRE